MRIVIWIFSALAAAAACLAAAAAPPDSRPGMRDAGPGVEFFEKKVRPLLSAQCFACHSGANTSGGLDLSTRDHILSGGALGPAVTPGDPDRSLIVQAVRYAGKLKMPPRGKIPDDQIAILEEWVKQGAPWPSAGAGGQGSGVGEGPLPPVQGRARISDPRPPAPGPRKHWAFQPVRAPKLPAVKNAAWCRTPVDRFILAKLEANRLKPNPPADRRTLIRRATFDLTGLPPTPEEVDAFLADRSPDAWDRVIDRLLASPAYGERWGRHWLDVVRYADSNGLDWNEVFPNAWRYRDWVIRAFNEDMPYDQFIREQLAGDLLPAANRQEAYDHLVATGMLVMGPKLLAQQDRIKLGMDVVDEQIDVTSKAFLGLTVSCARCHDHKFDPIPTRDYYALAGIFKSTVTLKGTLPRNDRVMYWNERPLAPAEQLAESRAHAAEVKKMQDAVKKCKDAAEKARLTEELKTLEKNAPPSVPMTMAVAEGKVEDCPIHIRGDHAHLGPTVPRGFLTVLGGQTRVTDTHRSGRKELADWIAGPRNPLTARVLVNRVWLHHFGSGIVDTPDNFGKMGERPSHPALLDWLAATFIRTGGEKERTRDGERPGAHVSLSNRGNAHGQVSAVSPSNREYACGWSIKTLHRLIMRSAAYRMSSEPAPASYAKDPADRLHWRMDRRRLEAEALRDAMLAASGSLDRTLGGTLVGKTSGFPVREFPVDFNSRRRSVYLPALRVVTYDLLRVFDFAEPSIVVGKRNTTTVPTQALVMMNSPFVVRTSREFAGSLLSMPAADDRQRVEAAYSRALSRRPSSTEVGKIQGFIDDYERALEPSMTDPARRREEAWRSFCQSLFASTEFRYVD